MKEKIYLGNTLLQTKPQEIEGGYVKLNGESFYRISNVDQMPPFFMSIISSSDHWLFIGSNGGLTAGRKNAENALFPYYTHDKILDSFDQTGSKTIFLVDAEGGKKLWEPFMPACKGAYKTEVNLYKNISGSFVIFEEVNHDLGLCFRYSWRFSEKFGFIRTSSVTNLTDSPVSLSFIDGIQNILPYGVSSHIQGIRSNLVDAYKKCELDPEAGIGIYSLSAMIVDRAEPSEALKSSIGWHAGLEDPSILLSSRQIEAFRTGEAVQAETDIRAARGAYFVQDSMTLKAKEDQDWIIVAEVNQDAADILKLQSLLKEETTESIRAQIEEDVKTGTRNLERLVGMADGIQLTNDQLTHSRFFANVMFNIMRGGLFEDQYRIETNDFLEYLQVTNQSVWDSDKAIITELPEQVSLSELRKVVESSSNTDLKRIGREYLPLTFSRRHGDPSRPWNKFSINLKDENGNKNRSYEGNWRDIFQNWEALLFSFPEYTENVIFRFLNASTIDGYNPYRITRNGIDWEVVEPEDPWSFIGYWGDHQIIYLLKLLELSEKTHPGQLAQLLNEESFVYANVPYRIKGYDDMLENPRSTVDFDEDLATAIDQRVEKYGADGKLVFHGESILYASLFEKLLITFLAKLSNLIPGGGIWLNTQRPEWNDANNALVGYGVSMVTLYYMRRYLSFLTNIIDQASGDLLLSEEVQAFAENLLAIMEQNRSALAEGNMTPEARKQIMDAFGEAGEAYRKAAYSGFSGKKGSLSKEKVQALIDSSFEYMDHAIKSNKRQDGLYHSYNLVAFTKEGVEVEYLYEMLEGQVAVLSSGYLAAKETNELLDALKASKMYREDQYSYMLYPDRDLPLFLDRNNIPKADSDSSELMQAMATDGDASLVTRDHQGNFHFHSDFHNANDLEERLELLSNGKWKTHILEEREQILAVFEQMFNHHAFTGRSGTFFGYEGLGSIYWHMVSKLTLAIVENHQQASSEDAAREEREKMIDSYYSTRAGIGLNKSPELYGAFPTDPYSHTPGHAGAQQPGMTGQVKEDVLSRFMELGVAYTSGQLSFAPVLLRKEELLDEPQQFTYYTLGGVTSSLDIRAGELAFTICQTPVVYELSSERSIEVHLTDGSISSFEGSSLPKELSTLVMNRIENSISYIRVKTDSFLP